MGLATRHERHLRAERRDLIILPRGETEGGGQSTLFLGSLADELWDRVRASVPVGRTHGLRD